MGYQMSEGPCEASCASQQERGIPAAMKCMEATANKSLEVAVELRKRLEPVLQPANTPPRFAKDTDENIPKGRLVSSITSAEQTTCEAIIVLREILERLEL